MSKFTILIQGPYSHISVNKIDNYRKYGPVVYSTYQDAFPAIPNARVVTAKYYQIPVYNFGNITKQVFTTLNGLQAVDTPYVIKVRTDEYYTNLDPIIEKIEAHPAKYITNNVFFKGTPEPLHPSDHMIGGSTALLLKSFSFIRDFLLFVPPNYTHFSGENFNIPSLNFSFNAETVLFLGFLYAKGILPYLNKENMHEIFLENADMVNIDNMAPYCWTISVNGERQYHDKSDDLYKTYPSLKSIDEFWSIKY